MSIRNLLITVVCALSLCGGLWAQGSCHQNSISGVYGVTASGWVTLPQVAILPYSIIGVITVDEGKGTGPITQETEGGVIPLQNLVATIDFTVAKDCTITFKAACQGGCYWEGTGFYSKANKEMKLMFTKFGQGTPSSAAILVMKEL